MKKKVSKILVFTLSSVLMYAAWLDYYNGSNRIELRLPDVLTSMH